MKQTFWKRSTAMLLALVLILAAVPAGAMAAENQFTLIELKGTDVTLDETVFSYTGEEIRPNVTVRVEDRLLTLDTDYTLEYADNIQIGTGKVIVKGIATAAPSYGYTGTVEIPFEIKAAEDDQPQAPEFTLVELKGTDVTVEGTEFTYTGSPIEPKVTVTVEGKVLTADRDYTVSYSNNTEVGTGRITVKGIATASETVGYSGTVEIDFTIKAAEPVLTEIKDTDVTIEGTKFTYTGSYIEPKITVTVDGKALTAGTDYTLTYHSNIGVGTATAMVTGIESAGYTGTVNVNFTIEKDSEQPEYQMITLTKENVAISGTKFTYTGKAIEPKITVTVDGKELQPGRDYSLTYENNIQIGTGTAIIRGIATASETLGYTGEVKISFSIVAAPSDPENVEYRITKGDKSTWYQESSKTLSFTANGDYDKFVGVEIDGKDLDEKHYTVKKGSTVITLKNSYLKKLDEGKYTITIEFEDGEATGAFRVKAGLDASNPDTGDSIRIWFGLLGMSAAAAATLLLFRKKFLA